MQVWGFGYQERETEMAKWNMKLKLSLYRGLPGIRRIDRGAMSMYLQVVVAVVDIPSSMHTCSNSRNRIRPSAEK